MLYRYHITPMSSLCTELMSDTMFGHFCWALLYREGEPFLIDFLKSFEDNRSAPVLFSSAFLTGMLPCPSLPPPPRNVVRAFVKENFGDDKKSYFQGLTIVKKWNKLRYIKVKDWLKLKDNYEVLLLYKAFLKSKDLEEKENSVTEIFASNTINRITGTVQEGGGLFHREKIWYFNDITLDLYVEVNDTALQPLVEWFLTDYLPTNGFEQINLQGWGVFQSRQTMILIRSNFT